MNHSEPPHLSTGARRALHGLILLLLATLILTNAHGIPSIRVLVQNEVVAGQHPTRPYLPAVGSVGLRFAPPPQPPEPAPPSEVSTEVAPVAVQNEDPTPIEPAPVVASNAEATPETKPEPKESTPAREPARILLDDVRPAVRPEEFLPYFQIPGGKQPGELTVVVPIPPPPSAPAPIRPSSATYTQTPK